MTRHFRHSKQKQSQVVALLAILVVTSTGAYLIHSSHATSPYISAETESGTLAGQATKQPDSAASGGSYVHFGSTINPDPSGPATPASGWHVELADDFNAPLGTGAGEDNLWYPTQSWNASLTTTVNGFNGYETEGFNSSQATVSNGQLVLSAKYQNDVLPATGDGSGSNSSNFVQRNYIAGIVTSTTNRTSTGYKGFTWMPDNGSTWAFEIDSQWPVNTGELFNAWWTTSLSSWVNERDFFEGKTAANSIDSDWIYSTPNTGGKKQDYYHETLPFDPAAAMHRYTYVVYPNQSWSYYIDGVLQTWVGVNGIAPAETSTDTPMELIINYALSATTFTTGTRQFNINSVAVYQDGDHAGQGVTGGGIAPGTVVGGE